MYGNENSAKRLREGEFSRNMEKVVREAENPQVMICLENPGGRRAERRQRRRPGIELRAAGAAAETSGRFAVPTDRAG